MRTAFALAVLAAPAFAQPPGQLPKGDPERYGVTLTATLAGLYPQTDARAALDSAAKVLAAKRYDLFAAHFLDPDFLDAKVDERQKELTAGVEAEFIDRREAQRRAPAGVRDADRLPDAPDLFQSRVAAEARKRAFGVAVKDIAAHLDESPETPRLFRKMWRAGEVADLGNAATAKHPDHPGLTVFLKKAGDRWVLENRQAEVEKPAAK